jgi:hypothetical protein
LQEIAKYYKIPRNTAKYAFLKLHVLSLSSLALAISKGQQLQHARV